MVTPGYAADLSVPIIGPLPKCKRKEDLIITILISPTQFVNVYFISKTVFNCV